MAWRRSRHHITASWMERMPATKASGSAPCGGIRRPLLDDLRAGLQPVLAVDDNALVLGKPFSDHRSIRLGLGHDDIAHFDSHVGLYDEQVAAFRPALRGAHRHGHRILPYTDDNPQIDEFARPQRRLLIRENR